MALEVNPCNGVIAPPKPIRPGEIVTMNALHLLRHAKSRSKEDVDDHERSLSRRGRETARGIGRHLPRLLGVLDLVLCSSARRTRETLELALAEVSPWPRCLIEDELYLADREHLLKRLRRLDARDANVLLIGHNPGVHELAVALADRDSSDFAALASGKYPTAAYARFAVPADWSILGNSLHQLMLYRTPESILGSRG
jgi:phosphohistidine phosphatase